jgi:hypothetical protein
VIPNIVVYLQFIIVYAFLIGSYSIFFKGTFGTVILQLPVEGGQLVMKAEEMNKSSFRHAMKPEALERPGKSQ